MHSRERRVSGYGVHLVVLLWIQGGLQMFPPMTVRELERVRDDAGVAIARRWDAGTGPWVRSDQWNKVEELHSTHRVSVVDSNCLRNTTSFWRRGGPYFARQCLHPGMRHRSDSVPCRSPTEPDTCRATPNLTAARPHHLRRPGLTSPEAASPSNAPPHGSTEGKRPQPA
ncbi:hypothetical protein NDU88_003996 [Pleurodeles waltl]|uniref:Secreted protein n=1 Tax=Pleurodeles waltl TaxID=8319 RepID=A0AAV7SHH3_PLEWA|nr:hypothetical protein NDU88_003996 [Pleurodeles waltl]